MGVTNMECAVAVLASHRAARTWTDEAVAAVMLNQLGLDPSGVAKNAVPPVVPHVTDDQIAAAEAAHKKATVDLAALHAKRKAQRAPHEADHIDAAVVAAEQANFDAYAKAADAARMAEIRAMQAQQRAGLAHPPSGVQEPKS